MSAILPEATQLELTIERIYRTAKPSHLVASMPREVLMRVHFYHAKEKLLMAARHKSSLPAPFTDIQLFPDLSKYTLQLRRQLNPLTKAMDNHKIPYKWRYPATILVTKNGVSHTISTLNGGMKILLSWGIITS